MPRSIAFATFGIVALPLSLLLSQRNGAPQDGQSQVGPITATEFRLVRPDGSLCGVWSATGKASSLSLVDTAGNARLKLLTTEDDLVGAALFDGEGKLRSSWSSSASGECALVTYGDGQVPRIEISSSTKGAASIVVRDEKGHRRSFTGLLECGASAFTLFSPEDHVVATMTTPLTGEGSNSSVVLYDPKLGTMRAAMSVGVDGAPMFSLHGKEQEMRSSWLLDGDGGALAWYDQRLNLQSVFGMTPQGTAGIMTFDAEGNVIHRAPANFDRAPVGSGQPGGSGGGGRR